MTEDRRCTSLLQAADAAATKVIPRVCQDGMIQINAAARLPPKGRTTSRRLSIIEVAALATIVVSVVMIALLLFSMWVELEGRVHSSHSSSRSRRTASLCGSSP
jgi:hypothetical protein